MNIYSGEFFLGNAHCLSHDSQDLGIFPINSEKKQRILHNFTNILAKNTKTPSKNIGGWVKNIGALIKNIGTPIKNIGIIVRTPIPPILGLTRLQPTLHKGDECRGSPTWLPCHDVRRNAAMCANTLFQYHTNFTLTPNKENHNENM
jgi:hypothetical protein